MRMLKVTQISQIVSQPRTATVSIQLFKGAPVSFLRADVSVKKQQNSSHHPTVPRISCPGLDGYINVAFMMKYQPLIVGISEC